MLSDRCQVEPQRHGGGAGERVAGAARGGERGHGGGRVGPRGADVEVFVNGASLGTTPNDGAVTITTSNKGSGSYAVQVCETGGGPCSNTSTVVF